MTPQEIALFVGGMLCGASLTCTIAGFLYAWKSMQNLNEIERMVYEELLRKQKK